MQEVKKILIWRLQNCFNWSHEIRNSLWNLLAESFPEAFTPIGKVTAAVEPAVWEISKLWPLIVVFDIICSDCRDFLGSYNYEVDNSFILSPPKNCDLKHKNYRLDQLFLSRVDKHVKNVARHKVRCKRSACGGLGVNTEITFQHMKIPSFLFLNFFVEGIGNNLFNNFKDSCILEDKLMLGKNEMDLLCGLMAARNHFFCISRMFGCFYKLDNMIDEPFTKGFDSFKEAYLGKTEVSVDANPFYLNRKSIRHQKGAVYFAVYEGKDRSEPEEEFWMKKVQFSSSLDALPNLKFDTEVDIGEPEIIELSESFAKKPKIDSVSTSIPILASKRNKEVSESPHPTSSHTDSYHPESSHSDASLPEMPIIDDVEYTTEDDLFNPFDANNNSEEDTEGSESGDVQTEEENNEPMDEDDEQNILDRLQNLENHNSKCKIDYRLQTFQDIGRYMKNNPGSFYDHSSNLWFCSICQNFAGNSGSSRSWVHVGVRLGDNPGRAFKRHFQSDYHEKNVEIKHLFGNVKSGEKSSHLVNMLRNFSSISEENEILENREIIKILFRTAHFIIKKMMSNLTFTSLVKLISDCGSDALKKFILKSPKNATYLSTRTFDNLLTVLNDYTEEPLLESLKAANYVTLFHDETTDISNHSEAAVFAMFLHEGKHKEHYLGMINMSHGQTAEKHYNATLHFCNQKGLDMSKIQFSDLDGCSTNSGDMQGFKLYFIHHNCHHLPHTCNCHTLALIPKHKIVDSRFKIIANADSLMLALYVLFKKSSIRLNIFEKSQLFLEMKVLKLICPSSTRWLTHEFCFRRILEVFEAVLLALSELYHERGEVEALGLLIQLTDKSFVLCALMLADTLGVMRPLTLWLQSSPSKADMTQISTVVGLVVSKLRYLASEEPLSECKFTESELKNLRFKQETFEAKCVLIQNTIESLPAASRLRGSSGEASLREVFFSFKKSVYQPFILEMAEEIETKIKVDPVSEAFLCLDVRAFPSNKKDLPSFGIKQINVLVNHFGNPAEASHPQTLRRNRSDPKIDITATKEEFEIFKQVAFDLNFKKSSDIKLKVYQLKKRLKSTLTNKSENHKIKIF